MPQLAGALADVPAVFGRDGLAERMDAAVLALGEVWGTPVGVPFTIGAITMIGNRRVLEDSGITTMPVTWDANEAAFRKIKAAKPDVIPFGFSTKGAAGVP